MKLTPIRNLVNKTKQLDPKKLGRKTFIYVDISSIDRQTKRIVAPQTIPVDEAPSRARKQIQINDVLVSTVRPNLNAVALVPNVYNNEIGSTGFCVLRTKNKLLDPTYLFYFTQTNEFVSRLTELSIGAGYPAVTDNNILESEIPLPPLDEQKRIAATLSKADRLRRLRRYARELSDGYLQSVFLEMFGDPVSNPRGWPMHKLGKHLTFITSGGRGWAKYYAPTGDRFIRSLDVQMNRISDSDTVYVKTPNNAEAERTQVQPGDVLLTITGSRIGRVAPVPDSIGKAYISQHVAILRLDSKLRPDFLSMFLSLGQGGQLQIQQLQYGQTKPGLGFQQIRSFKVPIPPLDYQQKFARIVHKYERLRALQRESARQAEHLFQSLLDRAFRGELTINH
jgi:type I restriction enzyme S subunit